MKTKSRIVIFAESGILSEMVLTAWGGEAGFSSVEEAEAAGKQGIKRLKWRVMREVTRVPLQGDPEVSYEYLSPVHDPIERKIT